MSSPPSTDGSHSTPSRRRGAAAASDAVDESPPANSERNGEKSEGSAGLHAFFGASFLTAALLLPHARVLPVGGGIVLAGVLRWGWSRLTR